MGRQSEKKRQERDGRRCRAPARQQGTRRGGVHRFFSHLAWGRPSFGGPRLRGRARSLCRLSSEANLKKLDRRDAAAGSGLNIAREINAWVPLPGKCTR